MTTPKTASAPPADRAYALYEEMRTIMARHRGDSQCDKLMAEALAASAQVREVEALGVCEDYPNCPNLQCGSRCDRNAKPAAEPVPVVQGDGISDRLSWLVRDAEVPVPPGTDATYIDVSLTGFRDTISQAIDTIADHARIVADWKAVSLKATALALQWMDRATTAEASLAACLADAERHRWLRHKLTCGHMSESEAVAIIGSKSPESLDAAIDAARSQP